MVEGQNHYEIVGVLREVYGLSDHDLAVFSEGRGERFQIETARAAAGIVSSQISELAEIRRALQELPLFVAVEHLISRTALRARLASLPPEDFKDPLGDLDTLVTLAAESAAAGATLADFAERLRSEMERQRPARLSDKDAIQLITAQKAKGSEWDAVIVPFLSRRITGFSPRYPSIIRVPGKDEVIAALHKEDREEEIREATKILRRQEMERLLYVAVTRARHTLVLALDRDLFSPVHDRLAVDSQLKYLRGDKGETSCVALDALATNAEACAETLRAAAKQIDASEAPAFARWLRSHPSSARPLARVRLISSANKIRVVTRSYLSRRPDPSLGAPRFRRGPWRTTPPRSTAVGGTLSSNISPGPAAPRNGKPPSPPCNRVRPIPTVPRASGRSSQTPRQLPHSRNSSRVPQSPRTPSSRFSGA